MADNTALFVALIVFEKLLCAGKRDLIDVLFHFPGRHADTVIAEAEFPRLFIQRDGYAVLAIIAWFEHLLLGYRVAAVGHHLADEDILIGI